MELELKLARQNYRYDAIRRPQKKDVLDGRTRFRGQGRVKTGEWNRRISDGQKRHVAWYVRMEDHPLVAKKQGKKLVIVLNLRKCRKLSATLITNRLQWRPIVPFVCSNHLNTVNVRLLIVLDYFCTIDECSRKIPQWETRRILLENSSIFDY